MFWVRGLLKEQKVEYAGFYDQRAPQRPTAPSREHGQFKYVFGIPSIQKEVIDRYLEEFLKKSLKRE